MRRFSRGRTHIGQIFPAHKTVDNGGFSHVGPSRKGKLRQTVPQEIFRLARRAHKLRFIEIQCHRLSLLPQGRFCAAFHRKEGRYRLCLLLRFSAEYLVKYLIHGFYRHKPQGGAHRLVDFL